MLPGGLNDLEDVSGGFPRATNADCNDPGFCCVRKRHDVQFRSSFNTLQLICNYFLPRILTASLDGFQYQLRPNGWDSPAIWRSRNLTLAELCRRVPLDRADLLLAREDDGDREHLLEEECLPTGGAALEVVRDG